MAECRPFVPDRHTKNIRLVNIDNGLPLKAELVKDV